MKHRILPLILALGLSLSLLSGCGGGPAQGPVSSAPQGGASSSRPEGDASRPEDAQPDQSAPGAPDASAPAGSSGAPGDEPPADAQPLPQELPAQLNRADFSLFQAGATFRLEPVNVEGDYTLTFTSSDEQVAAVDARGLVTAVSPGTATITALLERDGKEETLTCIVRCKFEADRPASGGGPGGSGDSSSSSPSGGQVDLAAFYTDLASRYEFPSFMQQADQELQDAFYPGLSGVATQQSLVYVNRMSMNMGELVLVQVQDGKDVDAVKDILQARIDGMVDGGAWYPEPTRVWSECSRVESSGTYILMVVSQDCDAIVSDFYALFES